MNNTKVNVIKALGNIDGMKIQERLDGEMALTNSAHGYFRLRKGTEVFNIKQYEKSDQIVEDAIEEQAEILAKEAAKLKKKPKGKKQDKKK